MNTLSPVEVELSGMAFGGSAFGRLEDGRAVFVPYALDGERVRIELVEEKAHYVQARLLEVIRPSEKRIAAPCRHFGECGGCHYQHLAYEHQLQVKSAVFAEQLRRIGNFDHLPPIEVHPSLSPWEYRNILQFHLTEQGKAGFQRAQSDQTLAIEECRLPLPPLQGAWKWLEFEPDSGIERVSVRCGYQDEFLLTLESQSPQAPYVEVEELPLSVVHLSPAGRLVLAGSDYLWMEVKERLFRLTAGAFFQVNSGVAAEIVAHLLATLELSPRMTLLDVYCGGGLYSAFLAPRVGRLIGIESSTQACQDFETNLDEFEHVELYEAAAEEALPYLDVQADVMLVDPPRSGLTKAVRQAMAARPPRQLAYISCDPSTFSRDARYLAQAGFVLEKLALFDMFPQTYHIESVSYWKYPE
jgi:23S rRNA (uracil1939-C5)-methyltransferase